MKTWWVFALLVPAVVAAQADTTKLRWVPNPRTSAGSWVTDPAQHLRAESRAAMDSTITVLERETTAEIAVVVIDSLDGLEPADAALLLHRRWGVGKRARDNGIVLLWSPALRKVYVAVGYGLEGVLPDARAGRIQDQAILPRFRSGDFDGGMMAGVTALAAAAREETYSGLTRAAAGASAKKNFGGVLGGILGVLAVAAAFWLALGRYPRRCPRGHGFMRRLSEQSDNAHLDAPSVLEEQLGSVDYDVWTCARCDATKVVPHRRLFSGYQTCPKCERRTLKRTSRQVVAPTYTSTGTREVTESCRNCGHSGRRTETIPMLVRSSSGSSSSSGWSGGGGGGGSSFGGGSSGGGGAGRSY
jgi:uncharacterized protein